jgi:RNA polymerase sigma-70 factor (ECF subfamily)
VQAGTVVGNLAGVIAVRPEEADIVAELKAGSEEAFSWLIATYHQPIYGISGFHGESSLRTWMYRIALHEASNQRRWWSRHCRKEVTIEAETGHSAEGQPLCIKDTLIDENESPFDMAAHEEIRARVEAELREISEPFRTVLILRDIEGLAYEEIAEILKLNLGTVKSRLMRGRAQIKARLAPFAEAAAKRPAGTARQAVSAIACVVKEAQ